MPRDEQERESGRKSRRYPRVKSHEGLEALGGALNCLLRVVGSHWKVFRRAVL